MNRRTLDIALWVTAFLLLTSGVISMIHAARTHRRQRAIIQRSLTQREELQRLETALAAAYGPVAAWERVVNEPIPLRALIRELALDREVVVREQSMQPMAISGWTMRRTVLAATALRPADLWRLTDRAQTSEHPWRLRHARLTVTADTPVTLDGHLRFETLVFQ